MAWPRINFGSTRFAALSPWQARLVLFAFFITVVWGAFCCRSTLQSQESVSDAGKGDIHLYRSIVERLHADEGYYDAVGTELRSKNYATRPFFNWRLPTLACFLGGLPSAEIGKWTLAVLASLTLAIWLPVLNKDGGFCMALLGGCFLLGMIVSCFAGSAFLFHELWAGILIAFSLGVHRHNRPLSIAAGLLALFIRELSLPFTVVMLVMAYKEKRRGETIAWLIGIAAFFLFLAAHATIVSGLLRACCTIPILKSE